jgi:hypothetical protein
MNLGWHFHISLEWSDHYQLCTRVHVCYVMILEIFGVDVSRDVDSVKG